jgi:hypothetical protein
MTDPPLPLSERIERSKLGQMLLTLVVALLLVLEVLTHLPADSAVSDRLGTSAGELLAVLGSEQAWGVFAPNPRDTSIALEGRVTFADGSTAVWTLPHGPIVGGNLRFYRWRKWLERVRSDDQRELWEPTARWIASLYDDGPAPVVEVELVRRFHKDLVEGPQPPYEEFTYFTLDLRDGVSG